MDGIQQNNKPKNRYLWKYLDLMKFLDFIETKELFFARMDSFDDVFEMSSSAQKHDISLFNGMASSRPNQWRNGFPEKDISVFKTEVLRGIYKMRELQKNYFASCFYNSDSESIAMWNLYSGMNGVAIRFDGLKLYKNIEADHEINKKNRSFNLYCSNVKYFNPDKINVYTKDRKLIPDKFNDYSLFKKSLYYQHEIEYRFVFDDSSIASSKEPEKKYIRIKLENLKDVGATFFVSSETEEWQINIVEKIIRSHLDTSFRVQKSKILTKRNIVSYMEDYTNQMFQKEDEALKEKYGDEAFQDS